MTQLTSTDAGYQANTRTTRRECFLKRLDQPGPGAKLERRVAKAIPKPDAAVSPTLAHDAAGSRDADLLQPLPLPNGRASASE